MASKACAAMTVLLRRIPGVTLLVHNRARKPAAAALGAHDVAEGSQGLGRGTPRLTGVAKSADPIKSEQRLQILLVASPHCAAGRGCVNLQRCLQTAQACGPYVGRRATRSGQQGRPRRVASC